MSHYYLTAPLNDYITQHNKRLQHKLFHWSSYIVTPISELHRHALSLHHLRATNSSSINKTASDHLWSICRIKDSWLPRKITMILKKNSVINLTMWPFYTQQYKDNTKLMILEHWNTTRIKKIYNIFLTYINNNSILEQLERFIITGWVFLHSTSWVLSYVSWFF